MIRLTTIALLMSACTVPADDPCRADANPVALEQGTAVGSAQSVLSLVEGTETPTLAGPDFADSTLSLSVRWTGDTAAWEDQPPDAGAHVCQDALRVPVELTLYTEDGLLDEQWRVEIVASEPGVATVVHEVGVDMLRGSWRPGVDDLMDLRLRVRVQWTDEGSEGVLTAIGTPIEGGPDEVWDVAVWPG